MDQATFIEKCLEDYGEQMEDSKDTVSSLPELEKCHQTIKDHLLETLPSKWQNASDSPILPDDLPQTLIHKLDSEFKKVRRMFERKQERERTKLAEFTIARDSLTFYNEQMDKYFRNFPNSNPKDVEVAHSKISQNTISFAKSKSGGELSSNLMKNLKADMDSRQNFYIERAEMIQKSNEDPAIGIDLGTTMCCVMVFFKGKCELVPNRSQGNIRTTPSYVTFLENGKDTFGKDAKEEAYKQPEITIYDAKRMIGRHYNDSILQSDLQKWPFKIINDNGNVKIKTWDRIRFPHEVSARLLTRFRLMAEDHLGLARGTIKKAVITVPAYFTEPQRRATSEAALCAGLQVLNILSEPTAAAIAYSWERRDPGSTRTALIYDLGGGTFDVAIAKVTDNNVDIICVDGDTHLGGEDFDQLLMDHCLNEFETKEEIDLKALRNSDQTTVSHEARKALSRLKFQCEQAKMRLSASDETRIQVDKIYESKDLSVRVTKVVFERLVRSTIRNTLDIMEKAIAEAKSGGIKSKMDIDDIILIGGSTRMPIVIEMVTNFFEGKQLCKHINPDEAVAFGAAIQAAILNKNELVEEIHVQDVTPMSLGTDIVGDKFAVIIPRNSKVPCEFKKTFVTVKDDQDGIDWNIYQGEDCRASRNNRLGGFATEGLAPMPAGKQKVDVTMRFDGNGLLHVDAVSRSTGESSSITITADRIGMDNVAISRLINECQQIMTY